MGTSLVVQWLEPHLPGQVVQVQSLTEELRYRMPQGQTTKIKNRGNIVANSIKTFKKFKKIKISREHKGKNISSAEDIRKGFPEDITLEEEG